MSDPAASRTFGWLKRWIARLDFILGAFLAFYIVIVANIISFRHPVRLDLTEEKMHSLSRATLDKLKLVQEEIWVIIPTFFQGDNPEHAVHSEVLNRARRLLREYTAAQPLIKIAADVDVFSRPERWLEIRTEYGLSSAQVNRMLFVAGPAKEYRQTVAPRDLATFKESRDPQLVGPEIKDFHGEKAITDAIARLIERKKRIVYFTQDKEELSFQPEGQGAQGGLSGVAHELDTNGIEARRLSLSLAKEIPADCEVLAIAGPLQSYAPSLIEVLDRYLRGGGRMLVCLGPVRTGIEDLLAKWGVEVLEGQVRCLWVFSGSRFELATIPAKRFNGEHPVTRVFNQVSSFEMRLSEPRALKAGGNERLLVATTLLDAVSSGQGESFYIVKKGAAADASKPGSYSLAMCVEQKKFNVPQPGFQRLDTRLVVVGARNFLEDKDFFQFSHRDFLMNSLEWLLGREERATVGGQEWAERVLPRDRSARRFLLLVPVLLLPGTFLAIGAFVYYLRRT